jgi:hypothetical protein
LNLQPYTRVLWRFRLLIATGFVLAVVLALLSYSNTEVWGAQARVLLTTTGFPWGATQPASAIAKGVTATNDPSQLGNVATLYAQLANGDAVRRLALPESFAHKTKDKINAQVEYTQNGSPLPVIDIQASTQAEADAVPLANRAAASFQSWVSLQEQAAHIPPSQRVIIQVLARADKPTVVTPRKKTLPIVVFIAVMTAFVGSAFLLENLRPSPEAVVAGSLALKPAGEPAT